MSGTVVSVGKIRNYKGLRQISPGHLTLKIALGHVKVNFRGWLWWPSPRCPGISYSLYGVALGITLLEGRTSILHTYAGSTGGDVYSGRTQNAMETAFSRITEQARHQYGCRLKFLTPTPSHKARGGQLLASHILWVVLAICWPRPESLRFELAVGSVGRPTVFTQPAKAEPKILLPAGNH